MSIEVTPWAAQLLERSVAAARRFNPDVTIRLSLVGGQLQPQLVDEPEPDDIQVTVGAVVVSVAAGIDGLIDGEAPHDRLVVRVAGSAPNDPA